MENDAGIARRQGQVAGAREQGIDEGIVDTETGCAKGCGDTCTGERWRDEHAAKGRPSR